MKRLVSFTEHEAVLLLDAYLSVLEKNIKRKDAIATCSKNLRRMAVNSGISVDESYRSESGIMYQMGRMEATFLGVNNGYTPTSLFSQIVSLYKNDRNKYDKLLNEAKHIAGIEKNTHSNMDYENMFLTWLSKKVSQEKLSDLYIALCEIEKRAKNIGLIDISLYENFSVNSIKTLQKRLNFNKRYTLHNYGLIRNINSAIHYLLQFAEEIEKEQPKEVQKVNSVPSPEVAENLNHNKEEYKKEAFNNEFLNINFNKIDNIAYSKPYKVIYSGEQYDVKSWSEAFLKLCSCLYNDYPSIFKELKSDFLNGKSTIEIVDEENKRRLRVAKKFASNFYIEANKSATDLVRTLKQIIDKCKTSYEDISILYLGNKEQWSRSNTEEKKKRPSKASENKLDNTKSKIPNYSPYLNIVIKHFTKGYRLNSVINYGKYKNKFEEEYKRPLDLTQAELDNLLTLNGIIFDGFVYMPQNMLDETTKSKLISFILKCFDEGKKIIYYDAIYKEFQKEFSEKKAVIYSSEMLKNYIIYISKEYSNFYASKNFVYADGTSEVDYKDEIRSYIKNNIIPVSLEDIYKEFSNIPPKKIKNFINQNSEFIYNSKGVYFHADCLFLSEEDLKNIVLLINEMLSNQEFISGDELINAIKNRYPELYENNESFSSIGWRDALKYKLTGRYVFNGNIISKPNSNLSAEKVFENFADTRQSFTLEELKKLANDIGTNIYFDAIYKKVIRINKNDFISKDTACFSVNDTDNALDKFCKKDYMPITSVNNFMFFPDAFSPWNIFLLEQYVAFFSDKYRLLHSNFTQNNVTGAIVKKNSPFVAFEDVLVDVLITNDIPLQKNAVLDYLSKYGYIARKSMRNIEELFIKVKARTK